MLGRGWANSPFQKLVGILPEIPASENLNQMSDSICKYESILGKV